jgi:hypothetical protein
MLQEYPVTGEFSGGIVFRRTYGIGKGIGFTKAQCEEMWGSIRLDDHMALVVPSKRSRPSTSTTLSTRTRPTTVAELRLGDGVKV